MKYIVLLVLIIAASCGNTYYIVRHAEKVVMTKDSANMMAGNPPLSETGKVRAYSLRDELKNKNITHIFSTNTIRTLTTAEPLSELKSMNTIQIYSPAKDSLLPFVNRLKAIPKGNVLVIGHSNTADDLVNTLCGEIKIPADLKDSEYDNLFIVKRIGKKMVFQKKKYGYPSSPEK